MTTVTIDDDIYSYLQQKAVPLEDDVNSVLRRLLELDEDRALLPQIHYRRAVLQALMEMDGEATRAKILGRVGELLKENHSDLDLAKYARGGTRWQHRAALQRKDLVEDGLLEPDAGYGIWKLTDSGWTEARKATS